MRERFCLSFRQSLWLLVPFFVLSSVSACNLPVGEATSSIEQTSVAQTIESRLVQMAETAAITASPSFTQTALTPTPIVFSATPVPNRTETSFSLGVPCDRAGAGSILDVTYPDDSRLLAGQPFTKVWRLVNRGSCTWNRNYQVVWFSGDRLGVISSQPLPGRVEPGESVDIAVDMLAPQQPGLYTSYWMLRNPDGELFGIGPAGNAPFWARIQVIAAFTSTPTPPPTSTPTPVILVSGRLDFVIGQGVDLDSGQITSEEGVDIQFTQTEEGNSWLEVEEGAGLMIFGEGQPSLNDCRSAIFSTSRIGLESLTEGTYLCYRTNQGLTGFLRVVTLTQMPLSVRFDFTTWMIP